MSVDGLRFEHELDSQLSEARLFAWIRPAFRTAVRHWPLALGAGFATLVVMRGVGTFQTLPLFGLGRWLLNLAIYALCLMLALAFVEVISYRLLLEKERLGRLNDWKLTLIRAAQIAAIWWIAVVIVVGVLAYWSYSSFVRNLNALSEARDAIDFVALYGRNRFFDLVGLIVVILLIPVFACIGVAAVLSTVFAVRSRDSALDCVRDAFRLAFDQRWRVFWASYALALLGFLLSLVERMLSELDFSYYAYVIGYYVEQTVTFASAAFSVGLTFVIERAYAAYLTLPDGSEGEPPLPEPTPPRGAATSSGVAGRRLAGAQAAHAPTAPAARVDSPASAISAASAVRAEIPAPSASSARAPQDIAAEIADALRKNQILHLVEGVERGLSADAGFFVSQPDSTLMLAKRLDAQRRSDLALRVALPYLKKQRDHRQHFTTALFVAEILVRDPRRLAEAARFLAQVKSIYPREPMLDQMIKKTDDAIVVAGSGAGA